MKSPLIQIGPTNKKPPQLLANKHPLRSSDLRRLSHELVNCLTVINLSCFKIRGIPTVQSDLAGLTELETIEKTVAEAAELLVKLRDEDEARSKNSSFHPGAGGRVYTLLKPNRRER